MKPVNWRTALIATAGLAAAGCNWWYNDVPSPDDLMQVVPWFDHMVASRAVHPYEAADVPRRTVPGTVPITGGEVDFLAQWQRGNTERADRLVNPTGDLAASLVRGDSLYQTFCYVCHGLTGEGDGPVGRKIGTMSLLTQRARGLSDGYLYSMIRYGRGIMGQYGDKIHRIEDRWAVVNYVRDLQVRAAGGPGGGAAAAGGAP